MDNYFTITYTNFQNKIYFLTHLIIVCFSIVLILYNEQVFGVQMVTVSLRYNDKVSQTFKLLVLLLAAFANFIASNDHTTLCINAIYSIVWLFIVIAHGTFYIHAQREKSTKKPNKLRLIDGLLCYGLLIIIIVADCFYYNYENKQWFLLSCLVIYIPIHWLYKLPIYFCGFLVCLLLNTTLYYWFVYTIFISCVIGISWLRHHNNGNVTF